MAHNGGASNMVSHNLLQLMFSCRYIKHFACDKLSFIVDFYHFDFKSFEAYNLLPN